MSKIPNKYDPIIRDAVRLYMPEHDWRLLKAQLYQESLMDPNAESPVGALGLAQFMPDTWEQVTYALGIQGVSPTKPYAAIRGAAWYMNRLLKKWTARRPDADRYCLALASYNAGFGNLLKAQRRAHQSNEYAQIIYHLPAVTGEHAKETITYVRRVWMAYIRTIITGRKA